ncbi:MAG: hypothetical protein LBJ94_00890 [Puniceicoccales bacterium]|jgi:hypothetical protein|nr:hypothetical protein [Puniceicoccales bacterium]
MNIGNTPIEIVEIGKWGEAILKIGDIPAAILEPKLTHVGVVYINTIDFEKGNWEKLTQTNLGSRVAKGCTRDPRLLEIAKKVFNCEFSQKDVGTVYPPLK